MTLIALVALILAKVFDRFLGIPILGATFTLALLLYLGRQLWQSRRPELTDARYRLAWVLLLGGIGLFAATTIYALYGEVVARLG